MSKYMLIFTLIVVLSYVMALLSKMYPMNRPGGLGQPTPNPVGFIFPAIAFTLFSGLRNTLGDTDYYIHSFDLAVNEGIEKPKIGPGQMYTYFSYLVIDAGKDYSTLLMITAIFSCVPIIYIIYKYAYPYELGIYLYVTTSYFSFSMNGIRQYMAAGVLILGTKYIFSEKKSDFFKYALIVLAAYMFHASALIMIPIYFVVRRKPWSLFTMALFVGTVVATVLFDQLLPSFLGALEDTSYSNYAENGWFTSGAEGGSSIIRVLVLAVPVVLAYMCRYRLAFLGKRGDAMVNLSIMNLLFYILSLYNWIFARLAIYTSIYVILLLTWIIAQGFPKEEGKRIYWSSVVLYAIYFYYVKYSIVGYRSDFF